MSHRSQKSHRERTTSARPEDQPTTAPLAFLLRDPHSPEELRRTIAAWSQFIDRHLHGDEPFLRECAQRSIVRCAAAHAYLQEYETALADVTLALAEAKASPNAYVQCKALEIRAIVQADQNDNVSALATFAEIWPLSQAVDFSTGERAELFLERGKCYGRIHRYQEAVDDFTHLLTLEAQCSDAWCWRGLAYAYLEQKEQAVSDATKAIELQPTNATFYRIRGVILRLLNRFAESLSDLLQAEALASDDPWVVQNKQETLRKWLFCRGPEAIEAIEEVLARPIREKCTAPFSPAQPSVLVAASSPAPDPQTTTHAKSSPKRSTPASKRSRVPSEQGLFF